MTRTVAYLRVSGRNQIYGDGYERQQLAIEAHAASNSLEIVRIFREEGVSGTVSWEDRAAWVEMLQFCLDNGIKSIIIERLDRLARDLMVQEHVIRDIRKRGMDILSVYEPDLCSSDPTRELMRQILGAIAQYDKRCIVLKLRGARQRMKARTGRCEGRKPYGHAPSEQANLGAILYMASEGWTLAQIKRQLESTGVPAPNGIHWHINTLSRILRRGPHAA